MFNSIKDDLKFSKEKICAMPFPSKLWILASLKHKTFITWSESGYTVLLHLPGLNDYLHSLQSMFKSMSCHEFLLNLADHGFEIVRQNEVNLLEFRHHYFTRDHLDLVYLISNQLPDKRQPSHMAGDPCTKKHDVWTSQQFHTAKSKITANYKAAELEFKLALKRRNANGVPLESELYKTPKESRMGEKKDEHFLTYHNGYNCEMNKVIFHTTPNSTLPNKEPTCATKKVKSRTNKNRGSKKSKPKDIINANPITEPPIHHSENFEDIIIELEPFEFWTEDVIIEIVEEKSEQDLVDDKPLLDI